MCLSWTICSCTGAFGNIHPKSIAGRNTSEQIVLCPKCFNHFPRQELYIIVIPKGMHLHKEEFLYERSNPSQDTKYVY